MRAGERAAFDRILAAAHIEDERQLPGQARAALRWLVRCGPGHPRVEGIAELVEVARRVGELEGLADHDNGFTA